MGISLFIGFQVDGFSLPGGRSWKVLPGEKMSAKAFQTGSHDRSGDSDCDHANDDAGSFELEPVGLNHVAEAGLRCDELGRDHGHPRLAEPDPQSGPDSRKR